MLACALGFFCVSPHRPSQQEAATLTWEKISHRKALNEATMKLDEKDSEIENAKEKLFNFGNETRDLVLKKEERKVGRIIL